ncbi:MAG: hypothetical protein QXI33_02165 [Candidatus Pacearchaeota archaeon]
MGIFGFRKKSGDTIDLTQSPGYKLPASKQGYKHSEGMVDLRSGSQTQNSVNESTNSGFDFLNTMASSATNSSGFSSESTNPVIQVSEMSEMKIKLRDITMRIEESSNEMYKLLQKIELLERKIERLERR